MSNGEEKRKGLEDFIDEMPDELRERMRDHIKTMERLSLEIPQPPREEILHLVEREKQARADRIAKAKLNILEKLLEAERAKGKRTVILAAVGWALAIIVPVILWWLSR